MFCSNCGNNLPDDVAFCPSCGTKLEAQKPVNPEQPVAPQVQEPIASEQPIAPQVQAPAAYEQPVAPQTPVQPVYQATQPNNYQPQGGYSQPVGQPYDSYGNPIAQPQLSMKWYKFLAYFSAPLGALTNIVNGIRTMTGAGYETEGASAELVYWYYDGLQTLDIIYGIVCILFGLVCAYSAYLLIKYKKNLITVLIGESVAATIASLIYALISSIILDSFVNFGATVVACVANVALIVINYIYLNKRKHLFVN